MAMALGTALAFVFVFGLPLWLVIEELGHRTRSWRAAPGGEAATVDGAARQSPRRAR
jgi:hypothetical protein